MMREDSGYGPFLTRPRRGNVLTHFIMAVLGAGLAVVVLLAFFTPASGGSSGSLGSGAVPAPPPSAAPLGKGAQDIAARVKPGVVIINTALRYNSEAAAGTGMVINSGGLVLTNNHVIEDSTSITATVPATGRTYPAKVLGYDKTGDIALIRLEGASGLATVPVGNSSSVKAGQAVVALGNAGGRNTVTMAAGQVTGLNQTITASDEAGSTSSETLHGMIQTNADIVAGDSGGPLAGPGGVIGMDTAGNDTSDQQAVGFAIPVNTALSVARQIAAGHASSAVAIGYPAFLGIFLGSGSASSPQAQAQQQEQQQNGSSGAGSACAASNAGLTAPSAIAPVASGALVDGTICGSPAAQAGLTGGAVITAVNGQAVGSPDQLSGMLARSHPGDTISVTWVSPAGQRTTSSIRLAAGPPQ
jgi:S1-C subfamily serine protease